VVEACRVTYSQTTVLSNGVLYTRENHEKARGFWPCGRRKGALECLYNITSHGLMLSFIRNLLLCLVFFLPIPSAMAQDAAVVYGPVQPKGLVVMELFSSQACVFCPKADALMQEFVDQDNTIALSCHVNYFDVKVGSLAIPACEFRQSRYESVLRAQPKYTPQMVINGKYDVLGYKREALLEATARAAGEPVPEVQISQAAGVFTVFLPERPTGDFRVWFILFDKDRDVLVADGGNKGQKIRYFNMVSRADQIGVWDGAPKTLRFTMKPGQHSKGFALLVQDAGTYDIVLAGKHVF
jgi:hypothetical protein